MLSRPDIAEIIARLGGEGAPSEERFDFTYGEIVADRAGAQPSSRRSPRAGADGRITLASFIFEQPRETPGPDRVRPGHRGLAPEHGRRRHGRSTATPAGTDARRSGSEHDVVVVTVDRRFADAAVTT